MADGAMETQGPDAAMAEGLGAVEAQGRAAVRARLVDVLDRAGMVRHRDKTVEAHREWIARLCDRLAYLSPQNLDVLAAEMVTRGQGRGRNEWPSEVLILTWARALQAPPFNEWPIVRSWLHSIEGPVAEAGGYLVELVQWLRRHGRPPTDYDMRQIRDKAVENARQAERVRERIAQGAPWPEDGPWMERRLRDEAYARQIVAAGVEHRATKGADE